MGRDKRQHERIEIAGGKSVHNISLGGMYVKTDQPRRIGSFVHFEFRLHPDLPPIKGRGKVIRAHYRETGKLGLPPGMALEFVDLSQESERVIMDYMRLRLAREKI